MNGARKAHSPQRNPHLVLPSNTPEAFLNHVDLLHAHRRASRASDAPQSFVPSGLQPIGVLLSRVTARGAGCQPDFLLSTAWPLFARHAGDRWVERDDELLLREASARGRCWALRRCQRAGLPPPHHSSHHQSASALKARRMTRALRRSGVTRPF